MCEQVSKTPGCAVGEMAFVWAGKPIGVRGNPKRHGGVQVSWVYHQQLFPIQAEERPCSCCCGRWDAFSAESNIEP